MLFARIDAGDKVAEIIDFIPEGLYHPSIQWIKIPENLESVVDISYWYDGQSFYPDIAATHFNPLEGKNNGNT